MRTVRKNFKKRLCRNGHKREFTPEAWKLKKFPDIFSPSCPSEPGAGDRHQGAAGNGAGCRCYRGHHGDRAESEREDRSGAGAAADDTAVRTDGQRMDGPVAGTGGKGTGSALHVEGDRTGAAAESRNEDYCQ
jgi:hypothetical protein